MADLTYVGSSRVAKVRSLWVVYIGWPNTLYYQFRTRKAAMDFAESAARDTSRTSD